MYYQEIEAPLRRPLPRPQHLNRVARSTMRTAPKTLQDWRKLRAMRRLAPVGTLCVSISENCGNPPVVYLVTDRKIYFTDSRFSGHYRLLVTGVSYPEGRPVYADSASGIEPIHPKLAISMIAQIEGISWNEACTKLKQFYTARVKVG